MKAIIILLTCSAVLLAGANWYARRKVEPTVQHSPAPVLSLVQTTKMAPTATNNLELTAPVVPDLRCDNMESTNYLNYSPLKSSNVS
jgi:hypothetical protein